MASSDDDVPEEITLDQGRDVAESSLKEQIENQNRFAAEEKSRRRKRNEQNREAKLEKQRKKVELRQKDEEEEDTISQIGKPQSSKATGFLDESIVQFLVEKERAQVSDVVEKQDTGSKPKRKKKNNLLANGRIKILNGKDDAKPEKSSASEFFKQRLFGSNVERSLQMIPQPPARLQSVAYRP